ncbi:hypothetical protein A8C32_08240 [Flavivirga aquatica]|uniref:Uncharacterized protein n=1 Tax=Flavivirga aquatica TaxID=1849968 RepID=A0A1E5SJ64_9FLAO|nr:hypothetical protein [Flavivirga aquatica]OEJ99153.1 hypothetical protein A8C32_08240 [Flavivirga aquatica]
MHYESWVNLKNVAEIKRKCTQIDIQKLVDYNTVTHSQYIDLNTTLNVTDLGKGYVKFNNTYQQLVLEANQLGYYANNMSTMRVYHIFPDIVEQVLNRETSTIWYWQNLKSKESMNFLQSV